MAQHESYIHINQKDKNMNQQLTPREKSILTAVLVVIGLALMSSMTSCYTPKLCDKVHNHMVGYR